MMLHTSSTHAHIYQFFIFVTIIYIAVFPVCQRCDALSIRSRFTLSPIRRGIDGIDGSSGNGGRGNNIPRRRLHGDGDDNNSSDDAVAFNLASLCLMTNSDDDGTCDVYDMPLPSHHSIKHLRGGGVSTKKPHIGTYINDKLDSLQTLFFQPFRAFSNKLPANPFMKADKDDQQSKLKKQQELLSSTKVQSVSAPNSDLLSSDDIAQCAIESNLIGGKLTPTSLDMTASKINQMYLQQGYVMNSVTGATLVPQKDGSSDDSGHVEIKVREVKVARPSEGHSSPVHIRFVDRVKDATNDAAGGDESIPSSDTTTYKDVPGRTRPSKLARMVQLTPGSHFRIKPELWSQLAANKQQQMGGGGKTAIFSSIHAVRPVPTSDNTAELEIIATENKPYTSLEYGITKSLYSDQWEGELDLKHANAFGGGEVVAVNVRKGKRSGKNVNWRMSIKDDYLAGSDTGYDVEVFRDRVGINSGGRKAKPSEEDEEHNEESSPLRTGALMRLSFPRIQSPFIPKAISTRLERVDPFAQNDCAQCIASMSSDIGPYDHNWNILSRPTRSTTSAIGTAGGRWDAKWGKTKDNGDDEGNGASTLQYATGTITSHQVMPLQRRTGVPTIDLSIRNVVSASTRHLPRHEAIQLGCLQRIRGYKYNYQQPSEIHQPAKKENEEKRSQLQALKDLVQGNKKDQLRPPIAISKAISGSVEVRVPFERIVKDSVLGGGTIILFGDWCVAQAQPSDATTDIKALQPYRHSSVGVGIRKVIQGLPLKMDACVTEHGTKGLFFGVGV